MKYANGARANMDMSKFKPELLEALKFMEEGIYWEIGYSQEYETFDNFIQQCREIIDYNTRPLSIHAKISLAIEEIVSEFNGDYKDINEVYPYFEADISTIKYILDKYVDVTTTMEEFYEEHGI